MFNLEIPADKFKKIDDLMNKSNIVFRVDESNTNSLIVVVKFKKQEQLDRAQEIFKSL